MILGLYTFILNLSNNFFFNFQFKLVFFYLITNFLTLPTATLTIFVRTFNLIVKRNPNYLIPQYCK